MDAVTLSDTYCQCEDKVACITCLRTYIRDATHWRCDHAKKCRHIPNMCYGCLYDGLRTIAPLFACDHDHIDHWADEDEEEEGEGPQPNEEETDEKACRCARGGICPTKLCDCLRDVYYDCPRQVRYSASCLAWNGFGFQGPADGDADRFVLAAIRPGNKEGDVRGLTQDELSYVRAHSGATTFAEGCWLGRLFVHVSWYEYEKRDEVLTALLRRGIAFGTQTTPSVDFDPIDDKVYNNEVFERKLIQFLRTNFMESALDYSREFFRHMNIQRIFYEFNWRTEAGKAFCGVLRNKYGIDPNEDFAKYNYFNFPEFRPLHELIPS